MKITNVLAGQPIAEGSPDDWRTSLGQILVAVETDAGLTGYGVGGGGAAGVHVIRTVLRDLLVGREAASVESLWDEMYTATLAFGRKGIAVMAISGVDLALWDLRGKAADQPVAELLGGTVGKPMPTYLTVWNDVSPEVAALPQAVKLHVENARGGDCVEAVVRAVRRAREVIGPKRELMIDAWMRWDVETTLSIADQLIAENLSWIEEPLSPDDFAGYAVLAERSPIPIAGGEHEFTASAFGEIIDRRLHQVLQPDVCWCGGMTVLIEIYRMAKKAGLRVCPHRGCELWGLHGLAGLDENPLAESGRSWMSWVGGQPAIIDGSITLPNAPGFGAKFSAETLQMLHS